MQNLNKTWPCGEGWFKEKLIGTFKNDIKDLINSYVSYRKSENLHFDGLVSFKTCKVLNEKVQKSYASSRLRVIQRKANSWEICIFLCNAIDLKKSMKGTLNV